MIILEGPDGAGKTRLAEDLSLSLGVEIAPKIVASDMSTHIDVYKWAMEEMGSWPRKIIYDRFPLISEMIYGPIYKGSVREGFGNLLDLSILHKAFNLHKPVVIYCLPPWPEVWNNVQREDTDNSAVKDMRLYAVWLRYMELVVTRSVDEAHWNYLFSDPTTYNNLITFIREVNMERHKLEY